MTTEISVECPYCGGTYFNYVERRTTERVRLVCEKGALKMRGDGISKNPARTVVCRGCGGEYDECDIKAEALQGEGAGL